KLAVVTVKGKDDDGVASRLDERLLDTPAIALESANSVACDMATVSCAVMKDALSLLSAFDSKKADAVRDGEDAADKMEDALGSYLVKLSAADMLEQDSHRATMLLHIIGDYERISDHAVNIAESAEEIKDKKLTFSAEAQKELAVFTSAISEILSLTEAAFIEKNPVTALHVEPLEQVIDDLRDKIKANHILRLQKSECTIEHGFILSDLLNNLERVADHCSNVAACLLEMREHDSMDMHKYLSELHHSGGEFDDRYAAYAQKYALS
ncbi:MAG: Na/Pi cotransporter family protein, partial [Clostridia bacterium]|nr:Na/Pi cotransporter family protein [Clostridia bacterium]